MADSKRRNVAPSGPLQALLVVLVASTLVLFLFWLASFFADSVRAASLLGPLSGVLANSGKLLSLASVATLIAALTPRSRKLGPGRFLAYIGSVAVLELLAVGLLIFFLRNVATDSAAWGADKVQAVIPKVLLDMLSQNERECAAHVFLRDRTAKLFESSATAPQVPHVLGAVVVGTFGSCLSQATVRRLAATLLPAPTLDHMPDEEARCVLASISAAQSVESVKRSAMNDPSVDDRRHIGLALVNCLSDPTIAALVSIYSTSVLPYGRVLKRTTPEEARCVAATVLSSPRATSSLLGIELKTSESVLASLRLWLRSLSDCLSNESLTAIRGDLLGDDRGDPLSASLTTSETLCELDRLIEKIEPIADSSDLESALHKSIHHENSAIASADSILFCAPEKAVAQPSSDLCPVPYYQSLSSTERLCVARTVRAQIPERDKRPWIWPLWPSGRATISREVGRALETCAGPDSIHKLWRTLSQGWVIESLQECVANTIVARGAAEESLASADQNPKGFFQELSGRCATKVPSPGP